MTKFKITLLILGAAAICATQCLAQSNAPVSIPVPALPTNSPASGLFNLAFGLLPAWDPTLTNSFSSGELTLESSALWKSMNAAGPTPYNSTELDYYLTRNVGLGAELISLGSGTGQSLADTCNLSLTLRKDVGNVAAYGLLNVGYDVTRNTPEGAAGAGLLYQYGIHVRIFLDTRYQVEASGDGRGFLTRFGFQIPF